MTKIKMCSSCMCEKYIANSLTIATVNSHLEVLMRGIAGLVQLTGWRIIITT